MRDGVNRHREFPHLIVLPKAEPTRREVILGALLQPAIVSIVSVILFSACLRASRTNQGTWWGEFWLDLGFAILGIFLTVALVNYIVERVQSDKLFGLRELAYDRMRIELCGIFDHMTWHDPDRERADKYSVGMPAIRSYRRRASDHFRLRPDWEDYVYMVMIQSRMTEFITWHKEEWEDENSADRVQKFCTGQIKDWQQLLATYSAVLSPQQIVLSSELIYWMECIAEESHWEGYVESIRGWTVHLLSVALLLMDTMKPLPPVLHWANDPRYIRAREEVEQEAGA
jgi:hypothetical protein